MIQLPGEMQTGYESFLKLWKEYKLVEYIHALVEWDQETYMPSGETESRAEQSEFLAHLQHEKLVNGKLLESIQSILSKYEKNVLPPLMLRNLEEALREQHMASALPSALVKALAKQTVYAQEIWATARKENNWSLFSSSLKEIIKLVREKGQAYNQVGIGKSPYEGLVIEYEPGLPLEDIDRTLQDLMVDLPKLVQKVLEAQHQPDDSFLTQLFPKDTQEALSRNIIGLIGFNWERGRLDISTHPFTTTTGPRITRITSRYDEHNFSDAFFSAIHEAGHAMYEQGFRSNEDYTPIANYNGMSIHESQSRFWEFCIARDRWFWKWCLPMALTYFPDLPKDVDAIWAAVNKAKPGFIRVDADPLTYNLHILLRYELEQEILLEGEKIVDDLPEIWNKKFMKYFGVMPPTFKEGVLQDVHWAAALFGYFPTYTLGNLFAVQWKDAMKKLMGVHTFNDYIETGNFQPLIQWLRENIHQHGRMYSVNELTERATGQKLSAEPFLRYVKNQYSRIYNIEL